MIPIPPPNPDPLLLVLAPTRSTCHALMRDAGLAPSGHGWRWVLRARQLRGMRKCPVLMAPDDETHRRMIDAARPETAGAYLATCDLVVARLASGTLRLATAEDIEAASEPVFAKPLAWA